MQCIVDGVFAGERGGAGRVAGRAQNVGPLVSGHCHAVWQPMAVVALYLWCRSATAGR
jgi:hypothetical protein